MATKKPEPREDPAELIPFSFRMPCGLIEALDAWVERINAQHPWKKTTRSDLIREILTQAVEDDARGKEGGPSKG